MSKTLGNILVVLVVFIAFSVEGLSPAPPVDRRPFVLVVYADWCPSCQRLKPTLALINDRYRGKIQFVRFDITSEQTAERSKEQAEKLGFGDFYEKNHDRTSLVIILDSSHREVFRTVNDYDPQHYETVLDQQLLAAHE
jgi:thiol-disulfide isomerase/thioredoxin